MLRTPQQGDILLINFDPQSGHEQNGERPALVISNNDFNAQSSVIIVCPITSTNRNYPLHVELDATTKTQGFVMCDQVKSLDYNARRARVVEQAPVIVVREVIDIIQAIIE